jgi:hypothetical protein
MKDRKNRKQLDLFGNGDEAKQRGIDRVLIHTPDAYKLAFAGSVVSKPHGFRLTSEDVIDEVGMPPNHPNAVGANMNALVRRGYLRATHTQVKAERTRSHSAKLEVWERT